MSTGPAPAQNDQPFGAPQLPPRQTPRLPGWFLAWRRANRTARYILIGLVMFWAVVKFVGSFAPTDFAKPVPVSTIQGNPCQYEFEPGPYPGRVVAATETNDAGPAPLYSVRCANDVVLEVAGP